VLGHLRNAGITLAEVIGQYHARGVVPLRRRPLHLYDMTTDSPPWAGTVTALEPPSPLEVQRRVAQAIGRSNYSWPPSRMLPMLLLTVNSCIKVRLDLQADKSPVVVKGPFFPRVVNPRYRICGTMCNARIQSSKAR
jgi:hypothetical protein